MKASIAAAPNSAAQICSRTRPSTRLHMTARPMIPAARVFSRSVRLSGATASAATSVGSGCEGGLVLDLILKFSAYDAR